MFYEPLHTNISLRYNVLNKDGLDSKTGSVLGVKCKQINVLIHVKDTLLLQLTLSAERLRQASSIQFNLYLFSTIRGSTLRDDVYKGARLG